MTKKIIAVLMALAMVFSFCACGKSGAENGETANSSAFSGKTIGCGDGYVVAVKNDGTIFYSGSYKMEMQGVTTAPSWTDIVSVSAGWYHFVGVKSDGKVVATGRNSSGQCDVNGWENIIAVSAGISHTVGLRADGTVVATGDNENGQCNVEGWTDIVEVATGWNHTVGLRKDGTVVATEYVGKDSGAVSYAGQCDVSGWKDIVAIAAGDYFTVGLKSDGTVVVAKNDSESQSSVANMKDIVAIDAGVGLKSIVGLKKDGTVVSSNGTSLGEKWTDIVDIDKSYGVTIGLKKDGTVVVSSSEDFSSGEASNWKDVKLPN